MAEPFLSEIRVFSFGFAPQGWAMCNGQTLPINQNQALFALLGTTYGGNGVTTFLLPNLQGRVPMHTGNSHVLGERAGEAAHTVLLSELPSHQHPAQASSAPGDDVTPAGHVLASPLSQSYGAPSALTALASQSLTNAGGSQAHQNMQPYLTLNFCIALQGIFPSRN